MSYEFDYSNLKGEMARQGITQRELSKRIKMSKTCMSDHFSNGKPWYAAQMLAIAEVLEISKEDMGRYFFDVKPQSN